MNIEKYSERVRGFLQSAQTFALAENHQQFSAEHVLKVLLDDEQGMAASLIERTGGSAKEARLANDAALAKLPKVSGGNGGLSLTAPLAKVSPLLKTWRRKPMTALLPSSDCCRLSRLKVPHRPLPL